MKTKIILLLFVALQMLGQTNVDRVAKALDTLAVISFNDWKMSPDLSKEKISGNPAAVVYDDSKWKNLKLREWIYPDSCWLRKEIILPDKILGQPISGTLKFFVEIDDEGYLFINGEYKGFIPWAGEFELTQNAKPGEKVVIAIRAINTEGPMGLLRAEVENVGLRKMVNNIAGIALSLRTAQKLLSFDTYQTSSNQKTDPGTDRSKLSMGKPMTEA